MSENQPTRREALMRLGAAPLLASTWDTQADDSSLCFMSAVEMARLIRAKKLSAREALAAHLKQIERVNPKVNAIVTLVPEMAAEAAAKADEMQAHKEKLGPLHGLPVAHKDLMETRGIRTTFGSPLFKDYIPTRRRSGGRADPARGRDHHRQDQYAGIRRGIADLQHRSSARRAIPTTSPRPAADPPAARRWRWPADWCRLPMAPIPAVRCAIPPHSATWLASGLPSAACPNPKAAFAWSTLSTSGCLGRSVADLALVLSTIAGPDPRAPLSINEPGELLARPLDRSFKGVRVAWFKDLGGVPFDPRVRTVVDAHRKTFESLGCIVEQAEPDFAPAEIAFRMLRAWGSATAYGAHLHEHPEAFKDTLKAEIEEGLRLDRHGRGTRRNRARPDLAALSGIPGKIRILRSAHHAIAALRRQYALPDGDRRR